MTRSLLALALVAAPLSLSAQGLGGLLDKKKAELPKAPAASTANPADALAKGAEFITYTTLATDQGMRAMDTMVSLFPPQKVEKLKAVCAKYTELKTKRTDGNIDAEQLKVASEAGEEASKLEGDWKSYQKDKSKATNKAHAQLGLMLLADAQAARTAPDVLKSLQDNLGATAKDPSQVSNAAKLRTQIAVVTAVGQQAPAQTKSFTTVRSIVKKIAEAEKVKLGADLSAEKVKDTATLKTSIKEIEG